DVVPGGDRRGSGRRVHRRICPHRLLPRLALGMTGERGGTEADEISWGDALDQSDRMEVKPPPPGRLVLLLPSPEAVLWGLFSAGGFVAAILLPAHLAILGIAFAAGWLPRNALSYERVLHLARNPLTKLYLLA